MEEFDAELIEFKIEDEGFDYFFAEYASPERMPTRTLKEQHRLYLRARTNLKKALEEAGIKVAQ